jgi:hypothetical protein
MGFALANQSVTGSVKLPMIPQRMAGVVTAL